MCYTFTFYLLFVFVAVQTIMATIDTLVAELKANSFGSDDAITFKFIAKLMIVNNIHSLQVMAGSNFESQWKKVGSNLAGTDPKACDVRTSALIKHIIIGQNATFNSKCQRGAKSANEDASSSVIENFSNAQA